MAPSLKLPRKNGLARGRYWPRAYLELKRHLRVPVFLTLPPYSPLQVLRALFMPAARRAHGYRGAQIIFFVAPGNSVGALLF